MEFNVTSKILHTRSFYIFSGVFQQAAIGATRPSKLCFPKMFTNPTPHSIMITGVLSDIGGALAEHYTALEHPTC